MTVPDIALAIILLCAIVIAVRVCLEVRDRWRKRQQRAERKRRLHGHATGPDDWDRRDDEMADEEQP